MQSPFFLSATLAALVMVSMPSLAAEVICVLPDQSSASLASVSPTQAAEVLQTTLPAGVTLSTASEAQLVEAFKAAAFSHEGYGAGLATLIAVGRPEFLPALSEAVRGTCPSVADAIIENMSSSAASPSVDEWAALAVMEGAAPAAGPAATTDPDGSPQ